MLQYMFYVTHWAACIYYFTARVDAFGPDSYVARNAERFIGHSIGTRYLLSLYMSVTIFVGEPRMHV